MDARCRDALKIGDAMFSRKQSFDSLNQEIALQFYSERADFTTKRSVGEEYASHLFSSYPPLARRELGNLLSSNLRPRTAREKWMGIHVEDKDTDQQTSNRKYLEYLTDVQWRAMYDPASNFVRATKEGDHDFAAFGNAAIKVGPNVEGNGLLYTNFHLRDCAWSENAEHKVDCLHRNWNPTARQLKQHFGDKISPDVAKACKDKPEKEFSCRHIVMPQRLYDYQTPAGRKPPFISLYVERESETILEEVGLNYFPYVTPRWQTVSGSPYGSSMATAICLPDGRTMQAVVRVLREAGEKFVDPPMVAVMDAIRSDIALYAGGITTVDIEYDERLGEVLRPIVQDRGGMPIGFEIADALREDIRSGFFLDKIMLPEFDARMTATEVRRRIEEHIRAASPLFEPIEQDYNTPLCEVTFDILAENGAFGPMDAMPEGLRGAGIEFQFRSPLADMADENEAEIFIDGMSTVLQPAAELDPSQMEQIDLTVATRDALRAKGFKAKWFKPLEAVAARRQQLNQQMAMQQGMETLGQAGAVAEQGGKGVQALMEAEAI